MRLLAMSVWVAVLAGCGKEGGGGGGGSPAVKVSAEKLFGDYRDNVAGADAKYLDKTLRVTGKVQANVEKTGDGRYAVGLVTAPNVMPSGQVLSASVVALFPASARDDLGKIRDWDEVAVTGKCAGSKSAGGNVGGIVIYITDASLAAHTPYRK